MTEVDVAAAVLMSNHERSTYLNRVEGTAKGAMAELVEIVIGRGKALSLYLRLDKSFYVESVEADGLKTHQDRCEDVVSHPLKFFCDDSRIEW